MNPAAVIRTIIEDAGLAVSGTDMFEGVLPDSPDKCVAIKLVGGLTPNPKWRIDFPSVQVLVRGNRRNYVDAYDFAYAVRNTLIGHDPVDLADGRVVSINGLGDFVLLYKDDNERTVFSGNYRLIVQPTTSDNREPLP